MGAPTVSDAVHAPTRPAARQARSRRTHRALLDAGFRLLAEQGPEALTIAAVSAKAGVTPGTVYRRFGDKDGLLDELQHEFTADFRTDYGRRMTAGIAPHPGPAAAIDVAVRALADTFHAHQQLLRVFVMLGMRNQRILEAGSRASLEGGRLFRDLLWPYRENFADSDPEHAIDVAHRLVYAACLHRVLNGPNMESSTPFSWDDLAAELSLAVARYLLGHA